MTSGPRTSSAKHGDTGMAFTDQGATTSTAVSSSERASACDESGNSDNNQKSAEDAVSNHGLASSTGRTSSRSASKGKYYSRIASLAGCSEYAYSLSSTKAKNQRAKSMVSLVTANDVGIVHVRPMRSSSTSPVILLSKRQPRKIEGLSVSSAESTLQRAEQLISGSAARKKGRGFHCKCCIASKLESICYIGNDGKIAAVKLTGPQVRHIHKCNMRGSLGNTQGGHAYQRNTPGFANRSCHPSSNCLVGRLQSSLSWTGSNNNCKTGELDVDPIRSSSVLAVPICNSTSRGGDSRVSGVERTGSSSEHTSSELADSLPASENSSCCDPSNIGLNVCVFPHSDKNQGMDSEANKREDQECITPIISQSKCLLYNADRELSNSADGTDLTTKPLSECHNAFNDISNADINLPFSVGEHQMLMGSRIARISRRKYLDTWRQQDVETVRLRKQEILARKNAESWMIDCALKELLHRLAPNGEPCVKVLVEAFEAIIHQSASDDWQLAAQKHELGCYHQNGQLLSD